MKQPTVPIPPPERLINLTPHEVTRQAAESAANGQHPEQAKRTTVCLPPDGRFARVPDEVSELGHNCLNAGTGIVTPSIFCLLAGAAMLTAGTLQLAQHKHWPQQVYPVYFEPQELVVPDLKLGRETISAARA
jgi:hypothetical protein